MKCIECVRLGLKSTLQTSDSGYTTLMGFISFWDEEGVYHSHNPNSSRSEITCSNGHRLRIAAPVARKPPRKRHQAAE